MSVTHVDLISQARAASEAAFKMMHIVDQADKVEENSGFEVQKVLVWFGLVPPRKKKKRFNKTNALKQPNYRVLKPLRDNSNKTSTQLTEQVGHGRTNILDD